MILNLLVANPLTSDGIGVWIAAILTIAIFSFLYKDNPLFKFAEHLYVGIGAGYIVVVAWHNDIATNVIQPMKDGMIAVQNNDPSGWINIINPIMACVIGAFLFFPVIAPKFRWLTKYAFAFILGTFSGIKVAPVIKERLITQLSSTLDRICAVSSECSAQVASITHTPEPSALFNAVFILLGVLCGLVYFFFSLEHKGGIKIIAKTGIFILMIGFGASFGLTVMGRVSLLIDRIQFLLGNWLGLIG